MLREGYAQNYAGKLQRWESNDSNPACKQAGDMCNRTRQEKAHIAFGQGFNALGLPLVIDKSKWHLIPALQQWKIWYELKVEPTAQELAEKEAKQQDNYNLILSVMNDLKVCGK